MPRRMGAGGTGDHTQRQNEDNLSGAHPSSIYPVAVVRDLEKYWVAGRSLVVEVFSGCQFFALESGAGPN